MPKLYLLHLKDLETRRIGVLYHTNNDELSRLQIGDTTALFNNVGERIIYKYKIHVTNSLFGDIVNNGNDKSSLTIFKMNGDYYIKMDGMDWRLTTGGEYFEDDGEMIYYDALFVR
jgi:hypothetical protein